MADAQSERITAMAVDDEVKLAFAAHTELTKQLITLGTAVVTLEVALGKAFARDIIATHWQMKWSWGLLLFSIVCGIWSLMAATGTLAKERPLTGDLLYKPNLIVPAGLQILSFGAGMLFTICYGLEVA
jgi:hypothetical protein